MFRDRIHSLRFYINVLMLVFLILFLVLIGYNNQTALSLLRNRVFSNTADTASLYQEEFDKDLHADRVYISTILTNNSDFTTINNLEPNTGNFGSSVYQLTVDFQNAVQIYTADGFFCYLADDDYLIYATVSGSGLTFTEIKPWLAYMCGEESTLLNQWTLHTIDDEAYLVMIQNKGDSYLGCVVKVSTLLGKASEAVKDQLFIVQPDGTIFENAEEARTVKMDESGAESSYSIQKIDGERTFTVFQKMDGGNFYLARFVPYSEIAGSNRSLVIVVIAVIMTFLLIWALFYLLVDRVLRKPVNDLTEAIEKIQTGTLGNYIPASNQPFEFHQLSRVFNDMLAEIRDLKIDVYEKILQNQQLEIQYLKQQITPHFMINCLNTVDSLMDIQHTDLAKKLLKALSVHLRYTLSSGQTVTLREEMALTENYIELTSIRYPNSVEYICECDPSLNNMTAIPLLFLNFVENTVKYEVVVGKTLEIRLTVKAEEYKNQQCIHITIIDSGKGFSEEILNKLKKEDFSMENQNAHIGIFNVIQRAKHVYPLSEFRFCNEPGMGARIDIWLSAMDYTLWKGQHYDNSDR